MNIVSKRSLFEQDWNPEFFRCNIAIKKDVRCSLYIERSTYLVLTLTEGTTKTKKNIALLKEYRYFSASTISSKKILINFLTYIVKS